MPNWKKVIVSGSDASLNSLYVTGGVTGSLLGTASYANYALSASYALTASYSNNLQISGSVNNVDYIDFNTGSAIPAWKSGRLFWDNVEGCLSVYNAEQDITLQVGQENWTRVYNDTGGPIFNGQPVRITGTHGDHPEVVLAQSVQVSGSSNLVNQILGIATHDIEDGTFGYITTQGLVRGLNTSAFNDGDTLYVSSSVGELTNVVPTAPYEIIPVAQVVKAGPGGSGIIYVAVQQPLDFTDLSSVYLGSGTYADGNIWTYNGPSKTWRHTNQLSGSYGITGSLNVTQNIIGSRLFLSSSNGTTNGSTLTVYGSGSAQPVLTVQGSQGELFSITDSLSGSLFSVNDISGLPILEAFSDNTVLMGSYQAPSLNTTVKTTTTAGSNTIYTIPTASYDGAWFEYTAVSASNARAGTIMAIHNGGNIRFTETTTTDIGTTTGIAFTVIQTGGNIALTGSSATAGWTIKTIVRSI